MKKSDKLTSTALRVKKQRKESEMRECSLGHKINPPSTGGEFEKVLK